MTRTQILENINALLNEVDSPQSQKFMQLRRNCVSLGLSAVWCINERKQGRDIV